MKTQRTDPVDHINQTKMKKKKKNQQPRNESIYFCQFPLLAGI